MAAADTTTQLLLGFRGQDEADFAAESKALGSHRGGRSRVWTHLFGSSSFRQVVLMAVVAGSMLSMASFFVIVAHETLFRKHGPAKDMKSGNEGKTVSTHFWGQYSPYFSLAGVSASSADTPPGCTITFAHILSRHGARFPTSGKSKVYAELITRIQNRTTKYGEDYAFLKDFHYPLGADELTTFGEIQMLESGAKFYRRYRHLTKGAIPFIRASGSQRVVVSAKKFIQGFQQERQRDPKSNYTGPPPSVGVILGEGDGSNNTLDHGLCDAFENSDPSQAVQSYFANIFTPPILARVNKNLEGADLAVGDLISLLDLFPFHTLASTLDGGPLSPFCSLFTQTEWTQYDYFQSLGKYYGYGNGNPLGPTQGVGFVNELISRLTGKPVVDDTNVNHTLDTDPTTFPLDFRLYADFSHDNAMTSIFSALGLYNDTAPLSNSTAHTAEQMGGYSASWTVPFAARAYIEKMNCLHSPKPLIRILVNDRVVPLQGCPADPLGRCTLDDFLAGLSFAQGGGHWGWCFV